VRHLVLKNGSAFYCVIHLVLATSIAMFPWLDCCHCIYVYTYIYIYIYIYTVILNIIQYHKPQPWIAVAQLYRALLFVLCMVLRLFSFFVYIFLSKY